MNMPCARVDEAQCAGFDRQLTVLLGMREFWHGQAAVQEDEGWMVFELAVSGPLHADELRREDREARIAQCNDGLRVGYRVIGRFRGFIRGC